jgi:hypothetical protein
MKKIALTLLVVLFLGSVGAQNLVKMAPQIVVINFGPKNPHFDEQVYPHLKFVYTPQLTANYSSGTLQEKLSLAGSPEFLARAINEGYFKLYGFLLIDQTGNCYTEGANLLENVAVAQSLCANGKTLADNVKDVVKKHKTTRLKTGPLPWGKSHMAVKGLLSRHTAVVHAAFLSGHALPDFQVTTAEGKSISIRQVIQDKPTMIFFAAIPPTGNVETIYKFYHGPFEKPSKQIQKRFEKLTLYLSMLEGQFFDFNPKKALKKKYAQ